MFGYLEKIWQDKFKLIKEKASFSFVLAGGGLLMTMLLVVTEFLLCGQRDWLTLFVVFLLFFQYNRPTIIGNIVNRRHLPMLVDGKKTKMRFYLFQFLKENGAVLPLLTATIFLTPWMIFRGIVVYVWLLLIVQLIFYGVEIEFRQKRLYQEGYHGFRKGRRMGLLQKNLLSFVRMPFASWMELLLQWLLLLILPRYVEQSIASYIWIIFFLVDMELLEEQKMREYGTYYGKKCFLTFVKLGNLGRYRNSEEYQLFIKYELLGIGIILGERAANGWSLLFLFQILVDFILMFALSYRYCQGMESLFRERKVLKNTWFRLAILYFVLFALAPMLFRETLLKTDWYRQGYGMIFSAVVSLLLAILPLERMISISGGDVNEKRENSA